MSTRASATAPIRAPTLRIPAILAFAALNSSCGEPARNTETSSTTSSDATTATASTTTSDAGTTTDSIDPTAPTSSTESGVTAGETTSSGTAQTDGNSDTSGTTPATSDSSTSDGGGAPDCIVIDDPVACNETAGCAFNENLGLCNPICALIDDQPTCVMQVGVCIWLDRECQETGV